jgi:hypothetical protein
MHVQKAILMMLAGGKGRQLRSAHA